ncbi:DeoR/GlpR transcriptional regulator [Sinorhizobium meliloti]|uniref:DeoR/GlpR family DNA-binding transcription regulator n=1 Tax=Rhizobium meliloti TaxID=382 RepID=UPI0003DBA999|nr:DeoR/GlpR family DNA-binding transcription regulator [Sinorhizobium meliloti]ARS65905.1 DeoR family transcriptional regulator [Sinorhizobium meliloti RU11/001]RVG85634.1 DeoR/GlpR transcriptional regulator [Sinorhizobium meliloti]RVH56718.1 DeoR/GlpR transcriptional regulator [Sinorhizobium meliloti]
MSKIPAASRHQTIIRLINGGSGMSISAIAETCEVSTETIRRDLLTLERGGSLQRVYGGAIPLGREAALDERVNMERAEKQAIGNLVAGLIQPDQWIFMTGGSSVLAVAQAMRNGPPVTVMTNMPSIGEALQAGLRHRVILTGGEYDSGGKTLVGDEVFDAVRNCSFDLSIIGVYGLDAEYGLVERTKHNMKLKTWLSAQSRSNIYVADHTKIGAVGRYRSIPFADIETFVTDKSLDEPFAVLLTEAGASVLYPEESASPEESEISESLHLREKINDNG